MISPVLEDLAGRHAGRLKVVKVDVDANPDSRRASARSPSRSWS
jgi:thioredoxin-like negative regulator of GroEL